MRRFILCLLFVSIIIVPSLAAAVTITITGDFLEPMYSNPESFALYSGSRKNTTVETVGTPLNSGNIIEGFFTSRGFVVLLIRNESADGYPVGGLISL